MAQISIGAPLSAEVNGSCINTHHHGNLWDDYFIQSLKSPYEAPECHERCEKMIEEVKHLLLSEMRDGNDDLIKRLQMVDIFECLGIDRHFHHEIQAALDYVYRYWNELEGIGVGTRDSLTKDLKLEGIGVGTRELIGTFTMKYKLLLITCTDFGTSWKASVLDQEIPSPKISAVVSRFWNELEGIGVGSRDSLTKDLNATALGFRALRLHRYNVSSAVLENFKNENGLFFHGSTVEEEEVRCMLTLLRASEISFPGEKVMDEASDSSSNTETDSNEEMKSQITKILIDQVPI